MKEILQKGVVSKEGLRHEYGCPAFILFGGWGWVIQGVGVDLTYLFTSALFEPHKGSR